VSAGLTTTTFATCRFRISAIAHALPVTSSATRSAGPRLAANQLELLRHRLDPPRRANRASLHDRDLTELQVHVQTDRPSERLHLILQSVALDYRRTSGTTTKTDTRSQRNRASRRGGHRKCPSSKLIVQKLPARLRSPRRPLSRSTDPKIEPGQQPSMLQFHAPKRSCLLSLVQHARFRALAAAEGHRRAVSLWHSMPSGSRRTRASTLEAQSGSARTAPHRQRRTIRGPLSTKSRPADPQ
jgi:hypothetical protein